MSKLIDVTGKKFNMLTVVERLENTSDGGSVWLCRCECGTLTKVRGKNLKNGAVKSCGCLKNKPTTQTHGMSKTSIYKIWAGMKSRCSYEKSCSFSRYGGRGIKVCDEWKNSFESFYTWSLDNGYKKGLSIERVNNNGDYCPENCKWVSQKEQCLNRRTNIVYKYKGESHTLTEWCEALNLNYKLVHNRIYKLGWSFDKAVSMPRLTKNRKDE